MTTQSLPRLLVATGCLLTAATSQVPLMTLDGTPGTGPSFKGLYGKNEQLSDGSTVGVDDNYLRESILEPNAKIVSGSSPQMPSFQGKVNDEQLTALIEYIKAQK